MHLYTIDFIDVTGGWYTYDVDGASVFDAACNLLSAHTGASIAKIAQKY